MKHGKFWGVFAVFILTSLSTGARANILSCSGAAYGSGGSWVSVTVYPSPQEAGEPMMDWRPPIEGANPIFELRIGYKVVNGHPGKMTDVTVDGHLPRDAPSALASGLLTLQVDHGAVWRRRWKASDQLMVDEDPGKDLRHFQGGTIYLASPRRYESGRNPTLIAALMRGREVTLWVRGKDGTLFAESRVDLTNLTERDVLFARALSRAEANWREFEARKRDYSLVDGCSG